MMTIVFQRQIRSDSDSPNLHAEICLSYDARPEDISCVRLGSEVVVLIS